MKKALLILMLIHSTAFAQTLTPEQAEQEYQEALRNKALVEAKINGVVPSNADADFKRQVEEYQFQKAELERQQAELKQQEAALRKMQWANALMMLGNGIRNATQPVYSAPRNVNCYSYGVGTSCYNW